MFAGTSVTKEAKAVAQQRRCEALLSPKTGGGELVLYFSPFISHLSFPLQIFPIISH
jgi:hypothetical protein